MSHNTHDINKTEDGVFVCSSHNFPEFIGEGETEEAARAAMNRKIMYYADNFQEQFKSRIKVRIEKGLECECGHKLNGMPLIIYRGK